jgi:hypothetical protein
MVRVTRLSVTVEIILAPLKFLFVCIYFVCASSVAYMMFCYFGCLRVFIREVLLIIISASSNYMMAYVTSTPKLLQNNVKCIDFIFRNV